MDFNYAKNDSISASVRKFSCSGCLHDCGRFVMRRAEYFVVRCARFTLPHFLPLPELDKDSHQLPNFQYSEQVMKRLRGVLNNHSMRLLRLLSPNSLPPGRLMEIGCATGYSS